ncbi:class I SAM-dependent methyltransferase [Salipiger sp. 1_MG-2023]|uniref:class I SAM-dependent methyltransferase n=1 Tax=Salipiger sp. 1_MG-2023 TaxID=3062665 RepID=UPI0026E1B88E|nr:class I SAM-dependent methyltransferase [Salipiger sp. 1_MG-2023]
MEPASVIARKPASVSSNPYQKPDFYSSAIAAGRHRDIVGGRWDETGRVQMSILQQAGLKPHHHLLDIGAGALRLGCKAVPYLDRGHYWATDASRAILLAGHREELADPEQLDEAQLIEDTGFRFPGVSDCITHAIAFAVFPHLTMDYLRRALIGLRRFDHLSMLLFTVFLAPDAATAQAPYRQRDGVVTHAGRAPFHMLEEDVAALALACGWTQTRENVMLPRGQVLFVARPLGC